jgi:S1-C subfamily serine protease
MLPKLRKRGAVVVAARTPEAPYWEDGFEPGDVIHRLNGIPVISLDGFRARVDVLKTGAPVVVQIERDRKLRYIAFQL